MIKRQLVMSISTQFTGAMTLPVRMRSRYVVEVNLAYIRENFQYLGNSVANAQLPITLMSQTHTPR